MSSEQNNLKRVKIGSRVKVKFEGGKVQMIRINERSFSKGEARHNEEADFNVFYKTPFAEAVMGKRSGDVVSYKVEVKDRRGQVSEVTKNTVTILEVI